MGKDFKQITLFLCLDLDFMMTEGLLDDENPDREFGDNCNDHNAKPCTSALEVSLQRFKPKRPRHHSPKIVDVVTEQLEEANCAMHDSTSKLNQCECDQQLTTHLQDIYDAKHSASHSYTCLSSTNNGGKNSSTSFTMMSKPLSTAGVGNHGNISTYKTSPPSPPSIVDMLAKRVMPSEKQLFIVVRRKAPLNRVLAIWRKEVKKKSLHYVVRVKFAGKQGIDSGTMAMEYFTMVLHSIGSSIFPGGVPLYSTSHIQNGNFKASGEIVAASIVQGGPPPCFLDENVYGLMVNPNVPLHELNAEMHLTESDRALLESV